MPPRSVCLNVFTTSLGDANAAYNNDGSAMRDAMSGAMERRDSAQSGTLLPLPSSNLAFPKLTLHPDIARRSSAGSIASQPTPASTSPFPAMHRADLFHSLRPMASIESLHGTMTSKRKFQTFLFRGLKVEGSHVRDAGTRLHSLGCISVLHFIPPLRLVNPTSSPLF
jgi:hypothetical protein